MDSSVLPCSIDADDFDNDLLLDIVFAVCKSDLIDVIFGIGNGSFENLNFYSSGVNSVHRSVSTMDINSIGVLLGQGNGTFSTVTLFQLEYGSNPFSTVFGDFNGDGKLDMAVVNNGSDSLSILLQTC